MSAAFTISFDQTSEQNSPEKSRKQVTPLAPGGENGQQKGSHHDVLAWEVEFATTGDDNSQKTKKMPKFLRDREKARQARMEQLKRESETTRSTSPQAMSKRGTKSTGSPQVMKSKIPSPKFSAVNKQRTAPPPPRPASAQAGSISSKIKRSPAIKQPLLLVQSGPQAKSPERKALSASNTPLSGHSRSPKPSVRPASAKTSRELKLNREKSRSCTSLIRPTSARTSRELTNTQDRGFTIDFNSFPQKEKKVTKEVPLLKSEKVFLYCLLYTKNKRLYVCYINL